MSFQGPMDSSWGLIFPRDLASTCRKRARERERESPVERGGRFGLRPLSSLLLWVPLPGPPEQAARCALSGVPSTLPPIAHPHLPLVPSLHPLQLVTLLCSSLRSSHGPPVCSLTPRSSFCLGPLHLPSHTLFPLPGTPSQKVMRLIPALSLM